MLTATTAGTLAAGTAQAASAAPTWSEETFPNFQVGSSCEQKLSHIAVAAGVLQPQLRLYFQPCDKEPPSVVAVDLRKTEDTTVSQLEKWMCQVDPLSCYSALKAQAGKGPATEKVQTMEGLVGKGFCTGAGVVSEPADASTAEQCRTACTQKIQKNAEDQSYEACTGFSWDAKASSCVTYSEWPIKSSDPSKGEEAECYSVSKLGARRLQEVTSPANEAVGLDFFESLLHNSEGSSHLNVVSAVPACFASFSWYHLSQPLDVSSKSFAVIEYMVRKDAPLFQPLSAAEGAGQVKVLVQPACFKDCKGMMVGVCQQQLSELQADEALALSMETSPHLAFYDPVPTPQTRGGNMMLNLMGDTAYTDVFSPRDGVWGWLLIFGVATVALGFLLTAGCIACWTYKPSPPSVDSDKFVARLLYDGPEGEREVLLQPSADATRTIASAPGGTVKVEAASPTVGVVGSWAH